MFAISAVNCPCLVLIYYERENRLLITLDHSIASIMPARIAEVTGARYKNIRGKIVEYIDTHGAFTLIN